MGPTFAGGLWVPWVDFTQYVANRSQVFSRETPRFVDGSHWARMGPAFAGGLWVPWVDFTQYVAHFFRKGCSII
jgi:hypothetical protein